MRALSIMQPWSSLIVGWTDGTGAPHQGVKPIENRGRHLLGAARKLINERIAIHASKREDDGVGASLLSARYIFSPGGGEFSSQPVGYPGRRASLPRAAVVGVATVDGVVENREELARFGLKDDLFWYMGEVGILLRDRRMIAPIAAKGALGFWTLAPELEAAVRAQMGAKP